MKNKNILFTGRPGCGKTTLIEKIISQIESPCKGFFTREIREKGYRVGFSINTLDGKQGILAHRDIKSKYRVGKYGVNIEDIDHIAVPAMIPESEKVMVVVDEIGKMECFSLLFKDTIISILESNHLVLGSIPLGGGRFIYQIKKRKDIRLIQVSEKNRDGLVSDFFDTIMA